MKWALLEKEGIPFDDKGRVACAQFHYERIMSDNDIQLTRTADAWG
jgi:hypothetical protein